ncbi:MAG: hypothetical protein WA705_21735 [Candidatus Ozemobacteraceae bacterium]
MRKRFLSAIVGVALPVLLLSVVNPPPAGAKTLPGIASVAASRLQSVGSSVGSEAIPASVTKSFDPGELQAVLRTLQERVKNEATDDITISQDGKTVIWKVRSAATASGVAATVKDILGNKIKAAKGFDVFNTVLVEMASPSVENLESILEFIKQVDMPEKQVFINVLIAEMQIDKNKNLGSTFQLIKEVANGGSDISGTMTLSHSPYSAAVEESIRSGFNLYLLSGRIFREFLYAQQTNNKFKVLSNPKIVATHGKQAKVRVGEELNVRTNITYSDDVASIDYSQLPIGLALTVTPYLHSNGVVSMDILQSLSSLDTYDDQKNLANTSNRLIRTSAAAQLGQTVVLAGIIQKQKQRTHAGVPILSRIPGLGKLFDREDDQEQKVELMVFLTPEAVQAGNRAPTISAESTKITNTEIKNIREIRDRLESGKPKQPTESGKCSPAARTQNSQADRSSPVIAKSPLPVLHSAAVKPSAELTSIESRLAAAYRGIRESGAGQ